MEQRTDRIEVRLDRIEAQIRDLHNTSMQFVNTGFAEMERRLTEKMELAAEKSRARDDEVYRLMNARIDAAASSSAAGRLLVLTGAFGWIATLGVVVVGLLHH